MALRISDMTNRPILSAADLFEICHIATDPSDQDGHKSFSVSGEAIAEFCKTLNNGGFKGVTDASLDDFTFANSGVYFWSGEPPIKGMPATGILEVFSYAGSNELYHDAPVVAQRLTSGNEVYCRTWAQTVGWSSWSVLRNANGNKILSGKTNDGAINFKDVTGMTEAFFNQTPVVTLTPINPNPNVEVDIINLITADQTGFSVARFKSAIAGAVVTSEETVNNEYTTAGDQTSSIKSSTSRTVTGTTLGAWETADFEYYWVATLDG